MVLAKRPSHAAGADDQEVDRLVEVPLVDEHAVQEREPRLERARRAAAGGPTARQAMKMPSAAIAAPISRPTVVSVPDGSSSS